MCFFEFELIEDGIFIDCSSNSVPPTLSSSFLKILSFLFLFDYKITIFSFDLLDPLSLNLAAKEVVET